jgi:hypothetical protein
MAGDGSKIRMGAAWITYGSVAGPVGEIVDLGYTKGGVTVNIESQSHEVTVDQEGIAPVAETLMGRRCSVRCNMAESDYERLSKLLPESDWNGGTDMLRIASGTGAELMDYADELKIYAKANSTDYVIVYKAIPIVNLSATFSFDGERIWPVEFKGFVVATGLTNAGYILGFHEAS